MRKSILATTAALLLFVAVATVVIAAPAASSTKKQPEEEPVVWRGIFASCNKPQLGQSFFPRISAMARDLSIFDGPERRGGSIADVKQAIAAQEGSDKKKKTPTLLPKLDSHTWLGDIVYHDRLGKQGLTFPLFEPDVPSGECAGNSKEEIDACLVAKMQQRWVNLSNNAFYKSYVESTHSVIGTYDDHDASENDSNKHSPFVPENQQFLLDFLNVPRDHPRRKRRGMYSITRTPFRYTKSAKSRSSSSNNNKDELSVCTILLDNRQHCDRPRGDGKGDILGEHQWQWLEKVLATGYDPDYEQHEFEEKKKHMKNNKINSIDSVCAVTFIGSGVQIIADSAPAENWSEFPESRNRLFRTLINSGAKRFVFISGDVHYSEINTLTASPTPFRPRHIPGSSAHAQQQQFHALEQQPLWARCPESPFADVDIVEVTSSGLTHHLSSLFSSDNFDSVFPTHRRIGRAFLGKNFGIQSVSCIDPRVAATCRVHIGVASIAGTSSESDAMKAHESTSSSSISSETSNNNDEEMLVLSIEPKFFNKKAEPLPAGCLDMRSADKFDLAPYWSTIAHFVMFWKINVPFLMEETRLRALFFGLWITIGTVTVVVLLLVLVVRRMCCAGKKEKKD